MITRLALAATSLVALSCHEGEPPVPSTTPSVVTAETDGSPNDPGQLDVPEDPDEELKRLLNEARFAPALPDKIYDANGAQHELCRERLSNYPRAWLASDETPPAPDR